MSGLIVKAPREAYRVPGLPMKRLCIAVAFALSFVVLALAATATVIHNVNLRPTASTDQPAIRLLKPPEAVTLISTKQKNGYLHVKTAQGEEGWIWAKNLTVGGNISPAAVT